VDKLVLAAEVVPVEKVVAAAHKEAAVVAVSVF
jgi:hypothetical protein